MKFEKEDCFNVGFLFVLFFMAATLCLLCFDTIRSDREERLRAEAEAVRAYAPPPVAAAPERAESDTSAVAEKPRRDVRFVDFGKLMKESRPGEVLSRYVADYRKTIDEAVSKIDTAAARARKNKKTTLYTSLQNDRRDLMAHHASVGASADRYLRSIVKDVLSRNKESWDAALIDAGGAFYVPRALDATDEIVGYLKDVTPTVPELPKITIRDENASPPKTASGAKK